MCVAHARDRRRRKWTEDRWDLLHRVPAVPVGQLLDTRDLPALHAPPTRHGALAILVNHPLGACWEKLSYIYRLFQEIFELPNKRS